MLIIFRRLLNKSFHLLRSHLLAFLYLLDPIEDGPINREPGRLNGHFGLAFLTFVAIFLESTILLATSNFNYSNATLVYHKLYLRSFWKYTDVIFACSMFLTIFVFGNLTFNWKMAEKYRIGVNRETGRLVSNQIEWNHTLSTRILAFRRKARHLLAWTLFAEMLFVGGYWMLSLILNWTYTGRDVLLAFLVPFLALYGVTGGLNISLYFLLIVSYSRIQQVFLLEKIRKLSAKMVKNPFKPKAKRHGSYERSWRRFRQNQQEILIFFSHLRGYSTFWSPFISAFLLLHSGTFVYTLYASFFNLGNFNFLERSFFFCLALEIFLLFSFLSNQCSRIVRNSVQMYKANVSVCYQFQEQYRLPACHLIQMSKLISNYTGNRNGFRLVTQQIIDSRMFQIFIFYICRLFVKRFN